MVVGISGKSNSGKDTVGKIIELLTDKSVTENEIIEIIKGDILYDNIQSNWKIKKFAGKLKQIVSILTGIPIKDLEKQEVKNRVLGKEWDRYLLKEYWINDEYAQYEQFIYFATNEDMQKYVNNMGHTDNTCSQVGKQSMTVRQLLQEIGTEAMRNQIHPNIWINALFNDYISVKIKDDLLSKNTKEASDKLWKIGHLRESNWVITDMRFPNELRAVKDRDGITIRVNRGFPPGIYNISTPGFPCYTGPKGMDKFDKVLKKEIGIIEHPSETALDDAEFDYIIENNGTIEDLIAEVKKILEELNII